MNYVVKSDAFVLLYTFCWGPREYISGLEKTRACLLQ